MKLQRKVLIISLFAAFFMQSCNNGLAGDKISATQILKELEKGKSLNYKGKTISGDLDFTQFENNNVVSPGFVSVFIENSLTFDECVFEGKIICYREEKSKDEKVIIYRCVFSKNLTFTNSQFKEEVVFRQIEVANLVNLSNSQFDKALSLEGALLKGRDNYFVEAKFSDEIRFQRAVIQGNISFLKATIAGVARFQGAKFIGEAQFGAVKFGAYADFGGINANQHIFFNYADFAKQAIFSNSNFSQRSEFVQAVFHGICEIKNSVFYGKTTFEGSTFNSELWLDKSGFFLGKPATKDVSINKVDNLKMAETYIFGQTQIKNEDF